MNPLLRLEKLEPYIAIRLLIVQVGLAIALSWTAVSLTPLPPALQGLPPGLVGILDESRLLGFGYPLRELLWAGEWWRMLLGILLPGGVGLMVLVGLVQLPLSRQLETFVGRKSSLLIYLAGGLTGVVVDLCWTNLIPVGALGILGASAGAVWCLEQFDRRHGNNLIKPVPRRLWLILLVTVLVTVDLYHTNGMLKKMPGFSHLVVLTLSPYGLIGSWIAGYLCVQTIIACRISAAWVHNTEDSRLPEVARIALRWHKPGVVIWLVALVVIAAAAWPNRLAIDYRLWKLEPRLMAKDSDSTHQLVQLAEQHPTDLFTQKRLAIHYLRNAQWSDGDQVLADLQSIYPTPESYEKEQSAYQKRRLRLVNLTRQSAQQRGPRNYSGISQNYEVNPTRVLMDRAHAARLAQDDEKTTRFREELLESGATWLEKEMKSRLEESEQGPLIQALVLNFKAYVRTELGGDAARAVLEASRSVATIQLAENLDTLGWALLQRGEMAEALDYLQKALFRQEAGSSGTIHFHLAEAYRRSGDTDQAELHYQNALLLDLEWWEELAIREVCPDCQTETSVQSYSSDGVIRDQ